MDPEIAVVVPTYRRPEILRRLLDALARQTLDPSRWELVLVDNASHDPGVDALADNLPNFVPCRARAVRIGTNRGPAAARNLGWRTAGAPLVAFLDDDVEPEPSWLESGLAAMADPTLGVVQGRTRAPDGVDIRTDWFPAWSWWHVVDETTPFFEACNIFYRRNALDQTGGFDEELQWWGEDTAAGWQVVDAGWGRAFAPDAVVVHPIEFRGTGWHIRNGWREQHNIALAARHPGFRQEAFWRPWAFRKRDAAFVLAAMSAVAAVRWRGAALGVLPYLWIGRPGRGHKTVRVWLETVAVDGVRTASHLVGAIRHRVLVL
jgi:GT2 family glycosyltransferase